MLGTSGDCHVHWYLKALQEWDLLPIVQASIPQMHLASSPFWKAHFGEKPRFRQSLVLASSAVPLVRAGLLSFSASLDWGRQEYIAGVRHLEIRCLKPEDYLYKLCHRNLRWWLNFTGPIFVLTLQSNREVLHSPKIYYTCGVPKKCRH